MEEERLNKLERRNRGLRIALWINYIVLMSVVVFLIFNKFGMITSSLETHYLNVLDESGERSIGLSPGKDGPRIALRGNKDGYSIKLKIRKDAYSVLSFNRPGWRTRLHLGIWDNNPQLYLADEEQNTRAKLYLTEDGEPKLEFFDESGKVIWAAP